MFFSVEALSSDLLAALCESGWTPERKVDASVWLEPLEMEGYAAHPLAREVLTAFGGLTVRPVNGRGPNFSNDEPLTFDPLAAGSGHRDMAIEVEEVLGGSYFPIGEWLSYSSVFMEARGRVVATGMGWIWELGQTFEQALELAICANRPLLCVYSDPGRTPWPPPPEL